MSRLVSVAQACAVLMGLLISLSCLAQKPELVIPANHRSAIRSVAVSPDGTLVATSGGAEVRFWDYASGRLLKALDLTGPEVFTNDISSVAFAADGQTLAAITGNRFYLIDVTTFKLAATEDLTRGIKTADMQVRSDRYAFGVVVAHPTQAKFYYEARYDDRHALVPYDIARRASGTPITYLLDVGPTRSAKRITWSPQAGSALVTYYTSEEAVIINLGSGEVMPYPGGQYWLPNGSLLSEQRGTDGLTLNCARADGDLVWSKTIPEVVLEVGAFEEYSRHHGNLTIDPSTSTFYYGFNKLGYISGNFNTGAKVAYRAKPGRADGAALGVAPGSTLLLTALDPVRLLAADANRGTVTRTFGVGIFSPSKVETAAGTLRFALTSVGEGTRLLALDARGLHTLATAKLPGAYPTAISPNGRYSVTLAEREPTMAVLDAERGSTRSVRLSSVGRAVAIDDEGNVAVQAAAELSYYRTGSAQPAWQVTNLNHPTPRGMNYEVQLSPDGTRVVAVDYTNESSISDPRYVIAYATRDGKEFWRKPSDVSALHFTPDGKELLGTGTYKDLVRLEAKNGRETARTNRAPHDYYDTRFDATATVMTGTKRLNSGDINESIQLIEVASGKILTEFVGHRGTVQEMGFLADGFFLSSGADNTLRLWDQQTGEELAKLFLFEGRDDWVVLGRDGRFDATPWAMKQLYYVIGRTQVPLEQLYEQFYEPGLLGQFLTRSDVYGRLAKGIGELKLPVADIVKPPRVKLFYSNGAQRNLSVEDDEPVMRIIEARQPEATFTMSATAPGSRIAELRLYHNGKLLDGGTVRNLVVENLELDGPKRVYTVKLLPGDNDFRAVAINEQRTESVPSELRVRLLAAPNVPATPQERTARLFLMTIGINTYKNPRYNLTFAEADAIGLEAAMVKGLGPLVSGVEKFAFLSAQATRADILASFAEVKAKALPGDVFVFYYAGHGVMSEPAGKTGAGGAGGAGGKAVGADFYLVPYDVTQLYGNDEALAQRGISASELKELSAGIPAQKQLYLLDACQSAGAVDRLLTRGAAEQKAIAQLARSTGTHWLTASGSQQFANEFDAIGHGAFTYALLEALAGKAAGDDARVSVNELKAYLEVVVPELTQKYAGEPQYPASYGYGQDFPVSVLSGSR